MKKFICSTIIMIAVILEISISAYANTDNSYSNGTDMYSDGVVEFYSNIDDEDKLYKINLSDMTEEKVLNKHIISMVNKDQYLYLLTYEDEKSNLLKFNMQDNSVSIEKNFDSFVTNIALRDCVLYYVEEQTIFTYNLQTKENSIFIENENVDFIYFTDRNTLKYLVKNGSNYDTRIYDFNAAGIEQNKVSLFSLQGESEISLMSVSSYSPRLSAPSTTNSYYIHTSYGGLNECIHISGGSVLPNCVGYAWGRSYENLGYRPNLSKGDAGTWYDYNRNNGYYSYGKTPYLGAVAVWKKTGGAGHVAVVEVIDGDVVITSESGYNSSRWWKTTRSASNSNFSASSSYIFQGFIYVCGNYTYTGEPIKYVVCNTNDASNITATSATFNGTFTNPAGARIIKRGYQWGATPEMCNYTVFDCDITWADGLTHNMMGLSPNTTYYYKLVVQDENGNYIYGNTKSFTTLSSGIEKVICNTGDAYNITATSATLNGTFTNPSGARIVKRGFQWGATPEMCNFTVFDCDITWVDGLNHNMINLEPNTTYYYKLIVKGENGDYIYGNTKSFTTLPAPDTENPIITNLKPRYISEKSFTIKCNLYDNTEVTRVWLVIYSPNGEHQFGVSASNGDFSYTINTSDYGGAGYYSIHMYAFDANDNSSGMFSTGQFLVADDTIPPKLTNLSVSNVGDKVFEVNCNLWDNVDVTRLWMVIYCPKGEFQFAIPAKQGDFTYPIDTDIYGGLGEYVIHLYAFDDAENSSGMVSTGSIIPQYYIGYDANGGTGAPDTQVKKYGESLIIDSTQPVRAGYIFKGWSNISDSTEANYYPGESFEGNYDLMLYACWEPMSFKITFDANFVGFSETIKTVYYNSTYGDMPVLSKEGFAFLGWFTDPLYGSLITADTTVSILENQILYAHWEKLIPYTESTVTKSGAKLIIDTKVHNIVAPYDILIVGYKNNKFVTMKRVPHNEQNSPYILEGDIDEIKVMVWNGLSTLKPLCDAEVIPSSKWVTE